MPRPSRFPSTMLLLWSASFTALGACSGVAELPSDDPLARVTIEPPMLGANGRFTVRDASGAAIASVGVAGTGCKINDVLLTVSDDGLTYALTLPQLTTTSSGGTTSVSCIASILPSDRTREFGVAQVHYDGPADIGAATHGTVLFNSYNTGDPGPANNKPSFDETGPFRGGARADESFDDAAVKWSACDIRRALNVSVRLSLLRTGTAPSEGTLGGARSKLVIFLGTRPCTQRDGGAPTVRDGG